MIRLFLLIALLPISAAADILVRTGEHGPFTRLVIDFDPGQSFDIVYDSDVVRIDTDPALQYDLSDVYRRITRDRIEEVGQEDGSLVIKKACDCVVNSSSALAGGLIIDIFSRAQSLEVLEGNREDIEESAKINPIFGRTLLANSATQLSPGMILPGLLSRAESAPTPVEELKESLLRRLDQASSFGIELSPDAQIFSNISENQSNELDEAHKAYRAGQIMIDTRRGQERRGGSLLPAKSKCAPILNQPIHQWLSGPAYLDPSEPNEAILSATAAKLILEGFGSEALALLSTTNNIENKELLRELAALVDGPEESPMISRMAECSDLAGLFAAMSEPPSVPSQPAAIVAALDALPGELRQVYGIRVIKQLRRAGQAEIADIIRSSFARLQSGSDHEDSGELSVSSSGKDNDIHISQNQIARRSPDSTAALSDLINGYLARSEPVPPALFDQAMIMVRETEGSARINLERSVIEGKISARNFAAADMEIDSLAERNPNEASKLRLKLAEAVSDLPSDANFLRALVQIYEGPVSNSQLRSKLAKRATSLQVPHLAKMLLESHDAQLDRNEKLLLADLYISDGEVRQAARILANLTGDDVDDLRMRIATSVPPSAGGAGAAVSVPEPSTVRSRGSEVLAETEALRAEWVDFINRE